MNAYPGNIIYNEEYA